MKKTGENMENICGGGSGENELFVRGVRLCKLVSSREARCVFWRNKCEPAKFETMKFAEVFDFCD